MRLPAPESYSPHIRSRYQPQPDHYRWLVGLLDWASENLAVPLTAIEFESFEPFHWRGTHDKPPPATAIEPLFYADQTVGTCALSTEDKRCHSPLASELMRDITLLLKRRHVQQLVSRHLRSDMFLIGLSDAMRQVDHFIEKVCDLDLPVLLEGPFGCEHTRVACAIHFAGRRREQPFVEFSCMRWQDPRQSQRMLQRALLQAENGTLYLNGIDRLSLDAQDGIGGVLTSSLGQWVGALTTDHQCRIVASTHGELRQRVEQGLFRRELLAELSFLTHHLPPLAERPGDIPFWSRYFFEKHRRHDGQMLDDGVIDYLKARRWPDNLFGLERLIARFAALGGPVVDRACAAALDPRAVMGNNGKTDAHTTIDGPEADPLADALIDGHFHSLGDLHPNLSRALHHLAANYRDNLPLADLADAAFVSASHLSYLFKNELNTTFKSILIRCRITYATRRLLQDTDIRITDLCLDAGFGDLSHFEKTFRANTGYSPMEFRNAYRLL